MGLGWGIVRTIRSRKILLFIGFPPKKQISGDPVAEFSAATELSIIIILRIILLAYQNRFPCYKKRLWSRDSK